MKVDDPKFPGLNQAGQSAQSKISQVAKTQAVESNITSAQEPASTKDDAVKISSIFKLVSDATEEVRKNASEVNWSKVEEAKRKIASKYDMKEVARKFYEDYLQGGLSALKKRE